ncbi:hypothetical protein EDEG_00935 [Edhazardia aedis USNM 41457]|uniref:Uncharacterized protein n=1 Tax=Edhazardia aedis (strain USNM 41457) TaxID=1003232 RepID=J9DQS2_EDHAE|nr:hypothetical protein EDEG_00935 [Edhazardia aedis USNM 41457]|eukprot:EJW04915.1 hypothetical protein EDEG_00935 [Edhazardia aedis USNM 41457]
MLLFYLSIVFCERSKLEKLFQNRDPNGLALVETMIDAHKDHVKDINKLKGNEYYDTLPNNDLLSIFRDDFGTVTVGPNPGKASEATIKRMNSEIVPTKEELKAMSINEPVVIPYLVRPAQILLLMKHD